MLPLLASLLFLLHFPQYVFFMCERAGEGIAIQIVLEAVILREAFCKKTPPLPST